jgi:hypothetical protein
MVKSHQLQEYDTAYVYETVRNNILFAIFLLVDAWGDCLDRSLHRVMQKRSKTLGWFFQFMRNCKKEYTAYSIVILDAYIPIKGKAAFLNAVYSKYVAVVKPWIVKELKKKRRKETIELNMRVKNPKQLLLFMIQFITKALIVLFKYKGTCLQAEVHDILKQSKPRELWLLKQKIPKSMYNIASAKYTILKPIRKHASVTKNVKNTTCDASDEMVEQFVADIADAILNDHLSNHVVEHIIRQFQKISM